MRMEIPPAVDRIIKQLEEHGYEAYAVGGCVRDTLLGRIPEDWDITTSAKPEEVKAIFRRTIDTGIQHGTVTVMENHVGYEVTTYRIDGEYEDGRHPKSVAYTANLTEDLKRRDFTINAMAYSPQNGMVDAFGGEADLEQKIIRCVGKPTDRFTEDALRILRAIRFSAQLGFSIEHNTFEGIREIAPNLAKVSKERVQAELTKLLVSAHPEKIASVFERGVAPYISKRFQQVWSDLEMASQENTVFQEESTCWFPANSLCGWEEKFQYPLGEEKYLRWAAFLRFSGEQGAKQVLRDLKMDNDTISKSALLAKWCYEPITAEKTAVRKVMAQMDTELFFKLLELRKFAIHADFMDEEKRRELLQELDEIRKMAEEICEDGDCLYIRDLAVTGRDLIASGMKPGKEIGEVLGRFLDEVLERPEHNTKEYLLGMR